MISSNARGEVSWIKVRALFTSNMEATPSSSLVIANPTN